MAKMLKKIILHLKNLLLTFNLYYDIIPSVKYLRHVGRRQLAKEFLGGKHFMRKSLFRKVICMLLSVTTLFGLLAVSVFAASERPSELKPESTATSLKDMQQLVGTSSYADYMADHTDYVKGLGPILIPNSTVVGEECEIKVVGESKECITSYEKDKSAWDEFGWEENKDKALYLPATGKATWHFTIPDGASSLYFIKIEYYNCQTSESSVSSIQRKLYIDDRAPFSEASYITLAKHWTTDNAKVVITETDEELDYSVRYYGDDKGRYKEITDIYKDEKTGKTMKKVTTYTLQQDINGNSMSPDIVQKPTWNTYYCQDSTGYYHGYFNFYLVDGSHTFTLEAEREPVVVKSIELVPIDNGDSDIPTYEEVLADYKKNGFKAPQAKDPFIIEAEFPDFVSDSSVYATNDNTSAVNSPAVSHAQLYNVMGENSYSAVGQWAAYKFKVNESGLYKFAMRFKQNALQGMYACRAIKLSSSDGEYGLADGTPTVPFLEAYNAQFNYDKSWQSTYIGDGVTDKDGNARAFEFYFKKDVEYTVYLECSLGTLKSLIQRVSTSLEILNNAYLRIIQLTGTEPDEGRIYDFIGIMPEVLIAFCEQAIELEAVKAEFEELCGTNGSHITTLHTVAILLDKMGADEGLEIPANMSTLKSYLGTLGTWVNNSQMSSVIFDSISVCPSDADESALLPAEANFFQSIGFEISSFFYSFFTDYDAMGLTVIPDENSKKVDVWLATGRDQSQIWRSMVDAEGSFTDSTGVAATLKLVTGGTLLPSILSGKGPDVYMGLGASDVINYAIRDAVLGVSGNDPNLDPNENEIFSSNYYTYKTEVKNSDGTVSYKYDVVKDPKDYKGKGELTNTTETFKQNIDGNYVDAAMDTIRLKGVTYGIPQGMSFAMMFYRMDILASLGQEVPETWSELLALLPVLQTNNMEIGLTYGSAINFMLYQKGGNMWKYTDNEDYAGSKIDLDSDIALEAFEYVCELYRSYSFPVSFDASNRFRTGEMPIVIGDYAGVYNTLVVYATEISGLWEFTSLPGVVREDGTLNYDSIAGVNATVMLNGCDEMLGAWQFMQWQTSADVQANYSNRMVALIGPSAKYEAANINAIKNMSWTASEKKAIDLQIKHLSSIVNYPGSYIIDRYTKFAFLAAVNEGANPVESLQGYIDAINTEIERKRLEFDLPIGDPPEAKDS